LSLGEPSGNLTNEVRRGGIGSGGGVLGGWEGVGVRERERERERERSSGRDKGD